MPDLQSQSSQQKQTIPIDKGNQINEQLLTYAEAHPVDEAIRKLAHSAEELSQEINHDEEIAEECKTAPNLLAQELVHEYDVKCQLAEEKMRDLRRAEKEIKHRVRDLEQDQAREILEFEMKQRDMNAKLESAQRNLDEIKICYEIDKEDLNEKQDRLHKLHSQARILQNLAEKHAKEHTDLKEYLQKLDKKTEMERENANKLLDEYQRLQIEIISQIQELAKEEAALEEDEYIVSKRQEQLNFIESCGKEQLEEEALACRKAEELELKIKEELREAEQDVSEQHAAKKRAIKMSKNERIPI